MQEKLEAKRKTWIKRRHDVRDRRHIKKEGIYGDKRVSERRYNPGGRTKKRKQTEYAQ